MGLKDQFTHEKRRLETPAEKEITYYNEIVLPLVQGLIDQINQDPDYSATFKTAGDNGGPVAKLSDVRSVWAFQVEFKNRATNTSEGSAPLTLSKTEPRYFTPGGLDIGTEKGRNDAIARLVQDAAENKARPQSTQRNRPAAGS